MSTLRVDTLQTTDGSFSIDVDEIGTSNSGRTVTSFAALRLTEPTGAGETITLTGWNAGSQLGGGQFYADTTVGTDDGGLVAAVPSGLFCWRRKGMSFVTPEMFGALGNGVSDDTAKITSAIKTGYDVVLGPKSYVISAACGDTSSQQGQKVRGQGAGKTIILLTTTTASLCLCGWGSEVSGVWFQPTVNNVVTAIQIGDFSCVVTSNGCNVYNNIFGKGAGTLLNHIRLYNVWYSSIHDNYGRGIGGQLTDTLDTFIDGWFSVNLAVHDNTTEFVGRFINWRSNAATNTLANHCEGWTITGNAAAAQVTFFKSSNGLAPQFTNNIIDIVRGVAIESNSDRTQIHDNWIVADTANTSSYFIYLSGDQCSIQGSYINPQTSVAAAVQFAGTPEHWQIIGNTFQGSGTAVTANSGANYGVLADNIFISTSVRPFDLSQVQYVSISNNQYRNPTAAPLYPSIGLNIHKKQWTTTVTATLAAGTSSQDFSVNLPSGLFSGIPLCQVTLSSGSTPLVAGYVYDSSTSSTAVIRVMHPAGTAIPSATYRFCLTFTDQNY